MSEPARAWRTWCDNRLKSEWGSHFFICTLEDGHDGPHEAGVGLGEPPARTWTDDE